MIVALSDHDLEELRIALIRGDATDPIAVLDAVDELVTRREDESIRAATRPSELRQTWSACRRARRWWPR